MNPNRISNERRYAKKAVLKRAISLPEEVSVSDLGLPFLVLLFICILPSFYSSLGFAFFLQDTRLVIPFDRNLPDYVHEAMYMVEARLAMGELVRHLE
jgi:hypothetical protein